MIQREKLEQADLHVQIVSTVEKILKVCSLNTELQNGRIVNI